MIDSNVRILFLNKNLLPIKKWALTFFYKFNKNAIVSSPSA